jgi:PRTRC genetic system protein E
MMFKALAPLLAGNSTLMLSLASAGGDKLRFTITPIKGKDEDDDPTASVLHRPIVLTGTVDELDVDLPGHLAAYTDRRTSLREVFEDLDKQFEEAKKESEERIAAEKKRTARGIPTIEKPEKPTPPPAPPKPAAPASIL